MNDPLTLRQYADQACFIDGEAREIIVNCADEIERLRRENSAWADAFNKRRLPPTEAEIYDRLTSPTYDCGGKQMPWPLPNLHDEAAEEISDLIYRIQGLEDAAEKVTEEFERDNWQAMKRLLNFCEFPWSEYANDVTAEQAEQFMYDVLSDQEQRVQAAERLMRKAHDDHCACEQSKAATVHTLTVIAEACEEIVTDLSNGHDAPTLSDFAKATAVRARETLKRATT